MSAHTPGPRKHWKNEAYVKNLALTVGPSIEAMALAAGEAAEMAELATAIERRGEHMDSKEFAGSLREIADWYEANPGMPVPHDLAISIFSMNTKDETEAVARALAPCRKEHHDNGLFWLKRSFSGVVLGFCADRSVVCERVVVGTEEIPEQLIPAETRELIEWRCAPIFQES